MKRKVAAILYTLCVLYCGENAFARIGETEAQIEKRYGKAVHTFSRGGELLRKGYLHAGFRITVTYLDGVSASEFYQRPDESKLSDAEIDSLLAANSGGEKWLLEEDIAGLSVKRWKLATGDRRADYVERYNSLTVSTKRCFELEREQKSRSEKANVADF